jgi:hypothetical protein
MSDEVIDNPNLDIPLVTDKIGVSFRIASYAKEMLKKYAE